MSKNNFVFKILQLKREESLNRDFLFARYSRAVKAGGVQMENYEEVYTSSISLDSDWSIPRVLEHIYMLLNIEHPADYKARSLSISDIVCLSPVEEGLKGEQCFENYYVDWCGFQKLEKA